MKLSLAPLLLAVGLSGFAACSSETPEREAAPEVTPSASPSPTDEAESVTGVEEVLEDAVRRLEAQKAKRGELPADADDALRLKRFHTVEEASWDRENYNFCIVDSKSLATAYVQSEISPDISVTYEIDACMDLKPTRASDAYRSIERSLSDILAPATKNLAFTPAGKFEARLDEAIQEAKFGMPYLVTSSGEGGPDLTIATRELEKIEVGEGVMGLAYVCVAVDGLGKRAFEQYSPAGIFSTQEFVEPKECKKANLRSAALEWQDQNSA